MTYTRKSMGVILMSDTERTCFHGELTKGISRCPNEPTHTGGSKYLAPVCELHACDDSTPLNRDVDTETNGGDSDE